MYEEANATVNRGLSLGARIFLGSVAALFGAMMFAMAEPPNETIFYAFGAFCLFIALACFTRGRTRQFIGSCIGLALFLGGLGYLVAEIGDGLWWSVRRSQPSVLNAILYLVFIGLPGATYAYRARFGFPRKMDK